MGFIFSTSLFSNNAIFLFIKDNTLMLIVIGMIILLFGALIGAIGMRMSYRKYNLQLLKENKEHDIVTKVKCSIIDNLGAGIIAYDSQNKVVYCNKEFKKFCDSKIPFELDDFFKTYGGDKFELLLNIPGGEMRFIYEYNNHIYEIKNFDVKNSNSENEVEDIFSSSVELSKCNIFQVEDITEVKDADRRQKDMAANLSHELKTPIAIIQNQINANRESEYYDIIMRSCTRMTEIVNAFTKLSQENFQFQTPVINEIINKALDRVKYYPGREKVNIIFEEDTENNIIFADEECVITLIQNLLTNAIKYIDFEGKKSPNEIKVKAFVDENFNDKIVVEVTDNGRGIPKGEIDHIFDRFYRVDKSGSLMEGGNGLGLSIVSLMADYHDAKVQAISEWQEGSSFIVSFYKAEKIFKKTIEDVRVGKQNDKKMYQASEKVLIGLLNEALESDCVARKENFHRMDELSVIISKVNSKMIDQSIKDYLVTDYYDDSEDEDDVFEDDLYDDEGVDVQEIIANNNDLNREHGRINDIVNNKEVDLAEDIPYSNTVYALTETMEDVNYEQIEQQRKLEMLREPVVQMVKRKQEINTQSIVETDNSKEETVTKDKDILINNDENHLIDSVGGANINFKRVAKNDVTIHPEAIKTNKLKQDFFGNKNKTIE